MDLLKAEINRKRKVVEETRNQVTSPSGTSDNGNNGSSKYITQGNKKKAAITEKVAFQQNEDQDDMQGKSTTNVSGKEKIPLKSFVSSSSSSFSSSSSSVSTEIESSIVESKHSHLSVHQVKQILRQIGQPITYFGESDSDRLNRLVIAQHRFEQKLEVDEFRLYGGERKKPTNKKKGNSFDDDEDEDEEDDDDSVESKSNNEGKRNYKKHKGENDDSDDDSDDNNDGKVLSAARKSNGQTKRNEQLPTMPFSQTPGLKPDKVVYKYFRSLLKQWEWDLNSRPESEKLTSKGKMETKTQKQCKDYIRPLFKLCKKHEVPGDILAKLLEIVRLCEIGDFRTAHDHYIRVAIGNSAWPIGLTMVGIHERSGREKISTSKVAHAMNNEFQRKYLTSVKRLMSFAQLKRPDVAPSMKVL